VDEQWCIQAKAQRALDLAEESNKACSKMAHQFEEFGTAPFAMVPQEEAEHSVEVKGCVTGSSSPETVAAIFDDLHERLVEWVLDIEDRIYTVEQVIRSAVSFVDAAQTSSSSGDSIGETTENDSSCPAEMKQATNMQVTVQEYTRRLGHVEFDMLNVKDTVEAQAAILDVIQRDYQVLLQQKLLKVDGSPGKHEEVKLKQQIKDGGHQKRREVKLGACNHSASVEVKDVHHPFGHLPLT